MTGVICSLYNHYVFTICSLYGREPRVRNNMFYFRPETVSYIQVYVPQKSMVPQNIHRY